MELETSLVYQSVVDVLRTNPPCTIDLVTAKILCLLNMDATDIKMNIFILWMQDLITFKKYTNVDGKTELNVYLSFDYLDTYK